MKKNIVFISLLFLVSFTSSAQNNVALDSELCGRISVGVDKKITKGFHITLDEELRQNNNFGSFERLQTNIGAKLKVHPNVKIGVGYSLINPYSTSDKAFDNARHRITFDIAGNLDFGKWNISLKERLQMTHRTGDFNIYQKTKNALALKSRLTAKYKYSERLAPFAYLEIRNTLNAPVISANFDGTAYLTDAGSKTGEPGWFLDGFCGSYVNRIRGAFGVDYSFDRHNSLNFCIFLDRISNKVVDANSEGTKLKSYTRETGFLANIAVAYVYSF
ncbi:MAG: DUF2490 domain-containing protein [Bacteroidales bacterium]|nr:DUF2490 domain-containing protein [Bacteroidales bacterium]